MSELIRGAIDAILPEGTAWRVLVGGDLDKLLDGAAENWGEVAEYLERLATVRNPEGTLFLEELEKEFGIIPNPELTDEQRRDALRPRVYERGGNASKDIMQNALVSAGFDVEVYENDPNLFTDPIFQMIAGGPNAFAGNEGAFAGLDPGIPAVDPESFIGKVFQMIAGGSNAFAGNEGAFAGLIGGEILVNGEIFTSEKLFTSVCGREESVCGRMFAGTFDGFDRRPVRYDIPEDPATWPMVFMVAAPGGWKSPDFELSQAEVPLIRRDDFRTQILKIKPMHSWAVLVVTYV